MDEISDILHDELNRYKNLDRIDGLTLFYTTDFIEKNIYGKNKFITRIDCNGNKVQLRSLMSVKWLVNKAFDMFNDGTFQDDFPFTEDSEPFIKMVNTYEKYFLKNVPWKSEKKEKKNIKDSSKGVSKRNKSRRKVTIEDIRKEIKDLRID